MLGTAGLLILFVLVLGLVVRRVDRISRSDDEPQDPDPPDDAAER